MFAKRPFTASGLVILAVVAFTAAVTVTGLWEGEDGTGWKRTIRSDAIGYYGYLQAAFIDKDLGHEAFVREYVHYTPTGTLNKYFCGTSVMMLPAFAMGHTLAMNDPNVAQDGTSVYEQKAIAVAAWGYLLLGLLALRSLFRGLGIREGIVAWVLLALCLGTPLIQYAAIQPGWSHIYSFCLISCFLLAVHKLVSSITLWWLLAAAFTFALICLVRPVNAIVILAVPIVAGAGTPVLFRKLLSRPGPLALALVLGLGVIALQPALWYIQTGKLVQWGYENEGFYWTRPEILKVLFGARRGLFLWTPLLLLVAFSSILLLRKDRWRSGWTLGYWMISTYIISCWWIWYYGGGFGSRVYIDHYPVLVITMVLLLNGLSVRMWTAARLFLCACVLLNLAQLWQYHNDIIHHDGMDRRMYTYTFLRFDEAHTNKLGGNYQEAPYHPNGMEVIITESCDLDNPCQFWSGTWVKHPLAFSGERLCQFDARTEYAITFEATTDILPTERWLFMEIGLQRYDAFQEASLPLYGVTELRNAQDSVFHYKPFPMNPLPGTPGTWEQVEYRIPVPPLSKGDRLKFYLWNMDLKGEALIDDVFMRVSAVKPQ